MNSRQSCIKVRDLNTKLNQISNYYFDAYTSRVFEHFLKSVHLKNLIRSWWKWKRWKIPDCIQAYKSYLFIILSSFLSSSFLCDHRQWNYRTLFCSDFASFRIKPNSALEWKTSVYLEDFSFQLIKKPKQSDS